MFISSSPFFL